VEWRVMVELSGAIGASQVLDVHAGGSATPCSATTLGLSLAAAKLVLAGLQRHLVQAQAEEPQAGEMIASHVRCWLRCLGTSNIVALVAPPKTRCSLASATISRRFSGF
jgi:hypothetical protein